MTVRAGNPETLPNTADPPASIRRRGVRAGAWAGIAYTAAWIVGLFVAPSAPDAFASAGKVNRYFADHNSAALVQALFVHALAGVALVLFAVGVNRYRRASGRTGRITNVALVGGLAAAFVSFVQVGLAIALFAHVDTKGRATDTRSLFNAINKADTVKLILLAFFVGAACLAAHRVSELSRWTFWVGAITVPFLIVGGFAFVVDSDALTAILDLSLPLLLLWSLAVSITMLRRTSRPRVAASLGA